MKKFLYTTLFSLLSVLIINNLVNAASFSFSPPNRSIPQNCEDEIVVKINTQGEYSNAADIEVNYDPTKVQIIDSWPQVDGVQVKIGDAYESYVYNNVDTASGLIRVGAGSIFTEFHGDKTFIVIKFKSILPATEADFTINFQGTGKTLDSNIAQSNTSLDLLTSVVNGHYTFQNKECNKDKIPPKIIIKQPDIFKFKGKLEFVLDISDIGVGVDLSTFEMIINGVHYDQNSLIFAYTGDKNKYIVSLDPSITLIDYASTEVTFIVKDFALNTGTAKMILNGINDLPQTGEECTDNKPTTIVIKNIVNSINDITIASATPQNQVNMILISTFGSAIGILSLLGYLQLFFLPKNKKKKYYGLVFDKDTLLPVQNAEIGLYDSKSNELIKSVKSNNDGRYIIKVDKGEYYVLIRHDNYEFYNSPIDKNTYKGEIFKLENNKYLNFDFALKKNKDIKKSLKNNNKSFLIKVQNILQKIYPYILFALLILNIAFYLLTRELAYLILFIYHLILIIYYYFLINRYPKKNLFCHDSITEKRIGNVLIKVSNIEDDWCIVDSKISNPDGSFMLVLPKGKYQIIIHSNEYLFPSKIDNTLQQKDTGIIIIDTKKKKSESEYSIPLDQIK